MRDYLDYFYSFVKERQDIRDLTVVFLLSVSSVFWFTSASFLPAIKSMLGLHDFDSTILTIALSSRGSTLTLPIIDMFVFLSVSSVVIAGIFKFLYPKYSFWTQLGVVVVGDITAVTLGLMLSPA